MAFAAMLFHTCTVYREVPGARDSWGQSSSPPAPQYSAGPDGSIRCYHTDTGGTETITVGRVIRSVNVDVSLQYDADVKGGDRLILDDGRIVDCLAVRVIGRHHKIARCNYDTARQRL